MRRSRAFPEREEVPRTIRAPSYIVVSRKPMDFASPVGLVCEWRLSMKTLSVLGLILLVASVHAMQTPPSFEFSSAASVGEWQARSNRERCICAYRVPTPTWPGRHAITRKASRCCSVCVCGQMRADRLKSSTTKTAKARRRATAYALAFVAEFGRKFECGSLR